ncbi:M23 family metallopeptidase [Aestuariibacter sp. P117]|uniref:M23 family metallopeptidase n=2 Tax=Glaciecola petra TaxID=3075602 RepID=A0ABU2ZQW5_9ALTE|nr:M23 family metallopeptidase [Aestuariibacter sp. P117]MDT0594428.1 M23 family metallopeptidase [Aestuariibacter sp. P117]
MLPLAIFAQTQPILEGDFTQGSLVRGKLDTGAKVFLNDKAIKVSKKGHFVFGFGRDAALTQTLSWQLADETKQQTLQITLSKREYKIDKITGVSQKYVSPATEVLERIRKENSAIANARAVFTNSIDFTQDFILPAEGRISGVYGSQRYFNGEPRRPHFGLDIANITGTPVIAPAAGIVRLAHDDMYYSGGTLILDHGFGVSSTFIHLSKIHVQEGEKIEQGKLIAEIGATGRVTGPHLDWRINWFRERLDPALLVTLPQ